MYAYIELALQNRHNNNMADVTTESKHMHSKILSIDTIAQFVYAYCCCYCFT